MEMDPMERKSFDGSAPDFEEFVVSRENNFYAATKDILLLRLGILVLNAKK